MQTNEHTKVKIGPFFRNLKKGKEVGTSWVAEMTGWEKNEKGYPRLARNFVPESDLKWLGKKSEGWPRAMVTWELADGLYEILAYKSQAAAENLDPDDNDPTARRYFIQISGGKITEITREQLEAALSSQADEPESNEEPTFDKSEEGHDNV
jgi:hypothetical protein